MKIEYFRYLVTVGRLQSISAAAKFYNIRQNTLSTIVKQAEEEFGFQIFFRTPDGVACTPQGEEFIKLAKEIDIEYSRILGIKKKVLGKASVRMLMDPITCYATALPLTSLFYESGSRGNLRFTEAEVETIVSEIGKETPKIALVRLDHQMKLLMEQHCGIFGLVSEYMASDELCVVVSDQHVLASAEYVDYADLVQYNLLCHQSMEKEIYRVFGKESGIFLYPRCHDDQICRAVLNAGAVAVVSRYTVEHEAVWRESTIRVLTLQGMPKENRQDIMLAYFPIELGRERYRMMVECIRTYFGKSTQRGDNG